MEVYFTTVLDAEGSKTRNGEGVGFSWEVGMDSTDPWLAWDIITLPVVSVTRLPCSMLFSLCGSKNNSHVELATLVMMASLTAPFPVGSQSRVL